ncbi:type IV pilus twitching motility protein PilT [Candidatus Saccharibacteria bacterium]|nr:type IV pilus twitching motility protein PilT [Candidatus Saccharibacteria bacterium]
MPTPTPVENSPAAKSAQVGEGLAATNGAATPAKNVRIETLLEECVKRNASDLHIQVGLPPILRVDGALVPIAGISVLTEEVIQKLIFSTLDSEQREVLSKDKEFDYSFAFGEVARFRVNAFQERGNLAAAFRLIPNKMPTLADLGLPQVVSTFANYSQGLVLVTGPTGSGKSTTLAALIDKINQERAEHIITIEDPIEFTHKSKKSVVVQREVHYDTYSFARALKSVLRQDPDVVLLGEMRDLESMQSAITTAETGHLVFATLHTNSAAQSVDRIVDVFPAEQQPRIRTQLASILMAICSQRLVPAIGGGRIAACEILVANTAVRSIIREGKTHQLDTAIQTGVNEGMQTMDRTLAKLVQQGTVTFDNALEYAVDPTEFKRLAQG